MNKHTPKLGQHFLQSAWAARALARAAGIAQGDTVVEIGPGKGALTRVLLSTGARVVAIEKDAALAETIREAFSREQASGQLTLVNDDIRHFDPAHYKLQATDYSVAANIPYYLTGEIIRSFLAMPAQPRQMVLLLQKEVAERIVGRDKESILSIAVKAYGTPKIVAKVARGNFSPPPSVDSAILAITDISRKHFEEIDERIFFDIVRAGFASKRKLLAKNLRARYPLPRVLHSFDSCHVDHKARAEDVPLEEWKCVAKTLAAR